MDDGIPIGLILLLFLCLALSFFFSGTEMAFSSVSRIRMRNLVEEGNKRARRVLYILDHFEKALTTLLIGNNVVNITAATVATILATRLWGASSVTLVTLLLTCVIFLFSETLPKTLAKANSEHYAMLTSGVLLWLMRILAPLAAVFSRLTAWIGKPFRSREKPPTVTEEELRDIIEDAAADGALNAETGKLMRSAIRYSDATVHDIITPWKDVMKLPLGTPHEEVLALLRGAHNSRLPVIDSTGNVVGLLRVRKYLKATLRGQAPASLGDVLDPVKSIPVSMPIDDLLPIMSEHKTHFTLVRDEWDNVLGIVTVEDILERLVGDIYDEDDVEGGERYAQ